MEVLILTCRSLTPFFVISSDWVVFWSVDLSCSVVWLHHDFLAHASNLTRTHILILRVRLLQVTSILVLILFSMVAVVHVHHFALLHSYLIRDDTSRGAFHILF